MLAFLSLSQCNAKVLDTWGGKAKYCLISYFLSNISAKYYRNRIVYINIIASQRWDVFWDTVHMYIRHYAMHLRPSICGSINSKSTSDLCGAAICPWAIMSVVLIWSSHQLRKHEIATGDASLVGRRLRRQRLVVFAVIVTAAAEPATAAVLSSVDHVRVIFTAIPHSEMKWNELS